MIYSVSCVDKFRQIVLALYSRLSLFFFYEASPEDVSTKRKLGKSHVIFTFYKCNLLEVCEELNAKKMLEIKHQMQFHGVHKYGSYIQTWPEADRYQFIDRALLIPPPPPPNQIHIGPGDSIHTNWLGIGLLVFHSFTIHHVLILVISKLFLCIYCWRWQDC